MKHYVFSRRFRKPMTKKQARRLELIATGIGAVLVYAMMIAFFISVFFVWAEHPAEQSIDGQAYMLSIRNGVDPYAVD